MELSQERIDQAVRIYNSVTQAHKRAPVEKYVRKQLSAGESVELTSGKHRWSSALRFAGTPQDMRVEFVINPALPERFKKQLGPMQEAFEKGIRDLK